MSEPDRPPDDPATASLPPVPLIVMGVGALVAIALLAQAKEGGHWAIGGSLAGAVLLGSSLLGRLAGWAIQSRESQRRQDSERLEATNRIADHLGRIVELLHDSPLETAAEPTAPTPRTVEAPTLPEPDPEVGPVQEPREAGTIVDLAGAPDLDDPGTFPRELATARHSRTSVLQAELRAAREVQDAQRVIEVRGELLLHLPQAEHDALNRDVATWLLHLVQRRCLTGQVAVDVVNLAEQVARVFSETREGASLRASLPTLRRCAGLCPRCGQPYNGEDHACPRCLAAAVPSSPWPADPEDEESPTAEIGPNGHATAPGSPGNA